MDFVALLARLQILLNTTLCVSLIVDGRFFGIAFEAPLERIETLPNESQAVILYFSNGVTIDLVPGEQEIQETSINGRGGVELRLRPGLALEVLPARIDDQPDSSKV